MAIYFDMNAKQIARSTKMPAREVDIWLQRHEATGDVADAARSGRPQKSTQGDADALSTIVKDRKLNDSSRKMAKELTLQRQRLFTAREVRHMLQGQEYRWRSHLRTPALTAANIKARIEMCTREKRRSWKTVMFTDSKYFTGEMTTNSRTIYSWSPRDAPRRREQCVKFAKYKVHVYAGVTAYGATKLFFATGTTDLDHGYRYKNEGKVRGVGGAEYREMVLPHLIGEGERLYRSRGITWVFQQDGATSHTSKATLAMLHEQMHSWERVISSGKASKYKWSAGSPDLSLIENLWAIVEMKLWTAEYNWHDLSSFKKALETCWEKEANNPEMLRKLFGGMKGRVQECLKREGQYIGK
jgi:hypothetical protein